MWNGEKLGERWELTPAVPERRRKMNETLSFIPIEIWSFVWSIRVDGTCFLYSRILSIWAHTANHSKLDASDFWFFPILRVGLFINDKCFFFFTSSCFHCQGTYFIWRSYPFSATRPWSTLKACYSFVRLGLSLISVLSSVYGQLKTMKLEYGTIPYFLLP